MLDFAECDLGAHLDEAASQLPKKYQAVLTSAKIEAALTDAFDFTAFSLANAPEEDTLVPADRGPAEKAIEAYVEVTEFLNEIGAGPPAGHGPDFAKPGQAHVDFFWA